MTLLNRIPNQLFGNLDEFLNQTLRNFGPNPAAKVPGAYRYQSKDSYRLRLDLPGFTKEEISLSLEKDELKLTAKSEREDAFLPAFERTYNMPEDIDPDGISAAYEDGVLDLTFKKLAEEVSTTRNIKIH